VFRYGVAAALIASTAAVIHSQGMLDRAAILGSCSPLVAQAPHDGQWWECTPGAVSGYPDLSKDACTRGDLRGEVRYWLCPAHLVVSRTTEEAATQ
jgi:hypothetical protein